jgi:hypothetical protein
MSSLGGTENAAYFSDSPSGPLEGGGIPDGTGHSRHEETPQRTS